MEQYVSKFALAAEIERRIKTYKEEIGKYSPFKVYDIIGKKEECNDLLSFINTLEVKEVDLDESARYYLLHEHISPLNEVLHQADLKVEIQYHKDIEDAYKAGFELGMRVNNPITSADRGTAEGIIINLKRVEQDYHIDLTRYMEWLRNQVKKGE